LEAEERIRLRQGVKNFLPLRIAREGADRATPGGPPLI